MPKRSVRDISIIIIILIKNVQYLNRPYNNNLCFVCCISTIRVCMFLHWKNFKGFFQSWLMSKDDYIYLTKLIHKMQNSVAFSQKNNKVIYLKDVPSPSLLYIFWYRIVINIWSWLVMMFVWLLPLLCACKLVSGRTDFRINCKLKPNSIYVL